MTKNKVFGKRRMLHAKISNSLQLSTLSCDSARLLFTWMIAHADDEGRLCGHLKWIKGTIVPLLDGFSHMEINKYLEEMDEVGLIHWWTNPKTDEWFIEFPQWTKYQSFKSARLKPSDLPSFNPNADMMGTEGVHDRDNSSTQQNRSKPNITKFKKSEYVANKSFKMIYPDKFDPSNKVEYAALKAWQELEPLKPQAFYPTYIVAMEKGLPETMFYQFVSEIKQSPGINNGKVFNAKVEEYLNKEV